MYKSLSLNKIYSNNPEATLFNIFYKKKPVKLFNLNVKRLNN